MPPGGRGHRGQATIELALGLPVVFLTALVILQLALVGRDQLMVAHASREAARAAATEPAAGAAREGALAAGGGLNGARMRVDADRRGDRVVVTVRYHAVTDLPLVGPMIPDPWLTSTVTVRDERVND